MNVLFYLLYFIPAYLLYQFFYNISHESAIWASYITKMPYQVSESDLVRNSLIILITWFVIMFYLTYRGGKFQMKRGKEAEILHNKKFWGYFVRGVLISILYFPVIIYFNSRVNPL